MGDASTTPSTSPAINSSNVQVPDLPLSQPGPAAAAQAPAAVPAPAGASMDSINQNAAAGNANMAAADQITNSPLKVAPVPGVPTGPHARLLNMVQGLALGLDSFGKSIATRGKEGGVEEVQQANAQKQEMQQKAQQAALQQRNEQVNQRVNMAHAHMAQIEYQMGLMKLPYEMKENALNLSNATVDSFTKQYTTGQQMGYDMDDPAQAAEARQRMGLDPKKETGAVTVPFSGGQDTASTTKSITDALPAGKSLTDYAVFVNYNDGKHGTGGSVTLLPAQGQQMQMPATPRQVSATQAESEGMFKQGSAAGLSADPQSPNYNPQFAQFNGEYNTLKDTLSKGGRPTTLQIHNLHMAVAGPLTSLVASTTAAAKIKSEREAAAANSPVAKLATPEELAKPGSQEAITAKINDPATDPNDIPRLKLLLPLAGIAQQHDIALASQKESAMKTAEQNAAAGKPEDSGALLAQGLLTLTDLKSRGSTPKQITDATKAAIAYGDAHGFKYNPNDEVVGEKVLSAPAAQTFFGSARSLVQPTGMLDQLKTAHDALGNGNQTPPKLNTFKDWLNYNAGTPELATYRAAVLGTADDAAKVMGGGTPTDSLRDQFMQTFANNLNNLGFDGAIKQARAAVRSQVTGRIGQNRYVATREGDILQDQTAPANTTAKSAQHNIGDTVTLKDGRTVKIAAINPDGTFTY